MAHILSSLPRSLLFSFLAALAAFFSVFPASAAESAPPLLLANVYRPGIVLSDYWVSEKFDGIRAFWDGTHLYTRQGAIIAAPAWFTADWPKTAMDGELWAGRGRFAQTVATVRRETPDDDAWREIRYMVFDLPRYPGAFDERLPALRNLTEELKRPWVRTVEQTKVANRAALQALLTQTVAGGGEGLMLHRGASFYRGGRSDDLLKLKPHDDAEAKVLAHLPGKGKYQGQLGALWVETETGIRFRLGSGLSDAERRQPPLIGSWVTFRHNGFTEHGVPRFPRFLRIREDWPPAQ